MKQLQYIARRFAPLPARRGNSQPALERLISNQKFDYIELNVRRTRTDDDSVRVPVIAYKSVIDDLYNAQRIPKSHRNHPGLELADLTYQMLKNDSLDIITLESALRQIGKGKVILDVLDEDGLTQTIDLVRSLTALSKSKWKDENFLISSSNPKVLQVANASSVEFDLVLHLHKLRPLLPSTYSAITKLNINYLQFSFWWAIILVPVFRFKKTAHLWVGKINSRWLAKLIGLLGATGIVTTNSNLPKE